MVGLRGIAVLEPKKFFVALATTVVGTFGKYFSATSVKTALSACISFCASAIALQKPWTPAGLLAIASSVAMAVVKQTGPSTSAKDSTGLRPNCSALMLTSHSKAVAMSARPSLTAAACAPGGSSRKVTPASLGSNFPTVFIAKVGTWMVEDGNLSVAMVLPRRSSMVLI